MRVIAPFTGRVGLRQVSVGALVQPGTVVTTLDDISRVRVEFSVPEVFVAQVRTGSTVSARSSAFGERRFQGRVAVVDTRIDTATRTIRVISEFDNPDEALKPGLFMTVELELARRDDALLIAEEALDPIGDRNFVYVIRNDRARRVEVKLGQRLPGEVEITSGLAAGDQVVVRGIQRLRNDAPVRVTETLTRPTS
jgi:membrane fusion protein (multidrug efflux system)